MPIPHSLPAYHMVLAESPCETAVFLNAASAMLSDSKLQEESNPAVEVMAGDVIRYPPNRRYSDARDWSRDSWKYLTCRVNFLGVCTRRPFIYENWKRERVHTDDYIRDIHSVYSPVNRKEVHIHVLK